MTAPVNFGGKFNFFRTNRPSDRRNTSGAPVNNTPKPSFLSEKILCCLRPKTDDSFVKHTAVPEPADLSHFVPENCAAHAKTGNGATYALLRMTGGGYEVVQMSRGIPKPIDGGQLGVPPGEKPVSMVPDPHNQSGVLFLVKPEDGSQVGSVYQFQPGSAPRPVDMGEWAGRVASFVRLDEDEQPRVFAIVSSRTNQLDVLAKNGESWQQVTDPRDRQQILQAGSVPVESNAKLKQPFQHQYDGPPVSLTRDGRLCIPMANGHVPLELPGDPRFESLKSSLDQASLWARCPKGVYQLKVEPALQHGDNDPGASTFPPQVTIKRLGISEDDMKGVVGMAPYRQDLVLLHDSGKLRTIGKDGTRQFVALPELPKGEYLGFEIDHNGVMAALIRPATAGQQKGAPSLFLHTPGTDKWEEIRDVTLPPPLGAPGQLGAKLKPEELLRAPDGKLQFRDTEGRVFNFHRSGCLEASNERVLDGFGKKGNWRKGPVEYGGSTVMNTSTAGDIRKKGSISRGLRRTFDQIRHPLRDPKARYAQSYVVLKPYADVVAQFPEQVEKCQQAQAELGHGQIDWRALQEENPTAFNHLEKALRDSLLRMRADVASLDEHKSSKELKHPSGVRDPAQMLQGIAAGLMERMPGVRAAQVPPAALTPGTDQAKALEELQHAGQCPNLDIRDISVSLKNLHRRVAVPNNGSHLYDRSKTGLLVASVTNEAELMTRLLQVASASPRSVSVEAIDKLVAEASASPARLAADTGYTSLRSLREMIESSQKLQKKLRDPNSEVFKVLIKDADRQGIPGRSPQERIANLLTSAVLTSAKRESWALIHSKKMGFSSPTALLDGSDLYPSLNVFLSAQAQEQLTDLLAFENFGPGAFGLALAKWATMSIGLSGGAALTLLPFTRGSITMDSNGSSTKGFAEQAIVHPEELGGFFHRLVCGDADPVALLNVPGVENREGGKIDARSHGLGITGQAAVRYTNVNANKEGSGIFSAVPAALRLRLGWMEQSSLWGMKSNEDPAHPYKSEEHYDHATPWYRPTISVEAGVFPSVTAMTDTFAPLADAQLLWPISSDVGGFSARAFRPDGQKMVVQFRKPTAVKPEDWNAEVGVLRQHRDQMAPSQRQSLDAIIAARNDLGAAAAHATALCQALRADPPRFDNAEQSVAVEAARRNLGRLARQHDLYHNGIRMSVPSARMELWPGFAKGALNELARNHPDVAPWVEHVGDSSSTRLKLDMTLREEQEEVLHQIWKDRAGSNATNEQIQTAQALARTVLLNQDNYEFAGLRNSDDSARSITKGWPINIPLFTPSRTTSLSTSTIKGPRLEVHSGCGGERYVRCFGNPKDARTEPASMLNVPLAHRPRTPDGKKQEDGPFFDDPEKEPDEAVFFDAAETLEKDGWADRLRNAANSAWSYLPSRDSMVNTASRLVTTLWNLVPDRPSASTAGPPPNTPPSFKYPYSSQHYPSAQQMFTIPKKEGTPPFQSM